MKTMRNTSIWIMGVFFFLNLSACRNTGTVLHLPDRKESFKIFNYIINDGCISFKRNPKAKTGETICNEKFWIETNLSNDH
ncbi:MAG: hypothetical protein HC913_14630 [Microscillaceae bacterium]|nr:hypothetical protein [Microscillaceae bacterium]